MTKTFKIGEYAVHGIWKVTSTKDTIKLEGIDYNSKIVQESHTFPRTMRAFENEIMNLLYEITSSYYANKIADYITSKILKV